MSVFDILREKLKEKKKNEIDLSNKFMDSDKKLSTAYANKALATGETIEIVNQVEQEHNDEFCERERISNHHAYSSYTQQGNNHKHEIEMNDGAIRRFKFCPYCGKKIKVVEHE